MTIQSQLRQIEATLEKFMPDDLVNAGMMKIENALLRREIRKERAGNPADGAGKPADVSSNLQEQEQPMQIDLSKASDLYAAQVDLMKIRNPTWSMSKCHDQVIQTASGREALALSLAHSRNVNDVNKAHDGSSQNNLAGAGSPADPDEVNRLRREHTGKGLDKYMGAVKAKMASGMSASQAHDSVRRESPDLWTTAKGMPDPGSVHVPMQETLGITQKRLNAGDVTPTDTAQAEARLSRGRADLNAAEVSLAVSQATYTQVIGNPPAQCAPPKPSTVICRAAATTPRASLSRNIPP